MYIITGLGRCGTSITIKYLHEVGFNIGHIVHWNDEIRAGYELSTFYCFADWFYHEYAKKGLKIELDAPFAGQYWKGYTYREALNEFDKDERLKEEKNREIIKSHNERPKKVEVVKDPRITWHPDIIEAIYKARPDAKLIICHRDIKDIQQSRLNLNERYNDPKPRKVLEDYQVDFAEFYTRVVKIKIPYKVLLYPDCLRNHKELWTELSDFGLSHDINTGKKVWDKLIDKRLLNGNSRKNR